VDARRSVGRPVLGAYPSTNETRLDYVGVMKDATDASEFGIALGSELPEDIFEHPSIWNFAQHGLVRDYRLTVGCDRPGFYVGDTSNLDDLVMFWNLRACDLALWFVDRKYLPRYQAIIPAWTKLVKATPLSSSQTVLDHVFIWRRTGGPDDVKDGQEPLLASLGASPRIVRVIDDETWNGQFLRPPMMHFRTVATLGVLVTESRKPKLSFQLNEKPFVSHGPSFAIQRLVTSISINDGIEEQGDYTLVPPYIPRVESVLWRQLAD
jgi:hypothetical protein